MYIIGRWWEVVTSVIGIVSLSPLQEGIDNQNPLPLPSQVAPQLSINKGPSFHPPGTPSKDHDFHCQYPEMVGWEPCSTPTDRKCWLRRTVDGKQYDINTDYENDAPIGITRTYSLELKDGSYDADGMRFDQAKLFNGQYPGPWIEACWGDM